MGSTIILSDEQLQAIYTWVDEVPLSRAKRNITRDFSDGVLMAEVLHHYFPKTVDIKNYSNANSVRQKLYNWQTLNNKVFRKLKFNIDKGEIDAIVSCKPGAVELLLMRLQRFIAEVRAGTREISHSPEHAPNPHTAVPQQPAAFGGFGSGSVPQPQGLPASRGAGSVPYGGRTAEDEVRAQADAQIIEEKDKRIAELEDMVDILNQKVRKLDQLVRLKDSRINALSARVAATSGGALM